MKYWVIFNNRQEGPFTLEELSRYPLTPDTPVWHQGLTQWVHAKEVDELRELLAQKNPAQNNPYNGTPYVRQPQESVAAAQDVHRQAPRQQAYNPGQTGSAPRKNVPDSRPSNYLGWAIASTLLCCMPLGVVAIIYAASVNTKFDRGDVEGAKKASDRAQLWIMLSVVLGLLWAPIGTIIQLAAQM